MKLLTTIGFTVLFGGVVFSQEFDQRLLSKYSQNELATMQENTPDKVELMTYALDNAITFANYDASKGNFQELTYNEGDTYLSLGLEIAEQNQYFKLAGEDKLLVVKSKWVLTHEMEKK